MLGMFMIGIAVTVAGQWRGPLRVWPMVAETWAVVTLTATMLLGDEAGVWIGGGHLLIGYSLLGLLLARSPERVGTA